MTNKGTLPRRASLLGVKSVEFWLPAIGSRFELDVHCSTAICGERDFRRHVQRQSLTRLAVLYALGWVYKGFKKA